LRLTPRGYEVGLVDEWRWTRFEARRLRLERNRAALESTTMRLSSGARVPAAVALRQPEVRLGDLVARGEVTLDCSSGDATADIASVETELKYAGYLKRQRAEIERGRRLEGRTIPSEFRFEGIPGLSREVVERLTQVRPDTVGQASRIPGVTPAAVSVIAAYLDRPRVPA
jgi:tRNA uridine 5-carboxymethylaminomethyl modification enzyme